MKVKNELISIRIGNKQYEFNNLILDEYLKRFAKAQIKYNKESNGINSTNESVVDYENKTNLLLSYCLIKFDESISCNESTDLKNSDFDLVTVIAGKNIQDISEKRISIQYSYDLKSLFNYKTLEFENINKYYGKKITAIGFNTTKNIDDDCSICAILDTSNYNIYIQKNQSIAITRKDIIQSDAIFTCNFEKYKGPIHLAPLKENYNINSNKEWWLDTKNQKTRKAFLASVGLSSYADYIDKEFVIGNDIEIENNNAEIVIKGLKNYSVNNSLIFANEDLYTNIDVYPIKSRYKYIIFKYEIYECSLITNSNTVMYEDTGQYYYQAIEIDKFGKSNIKIKYERG